MVKRILLKYVQMTDRPLFLQLISEPFPGVKVLKPFVFEDARGCLVRLPPEMSEAVSERRLNMSK